MLRRVRRAFGLPAAVSPARELGGARRSSCSLAALRGARLRASLRCSRAGSSRSRTRARARRSPACRRRRSCTRATIYPATAADAAGRRRAVRRAGQRAPARRARARGRRGARRPALARPAFLVPALPIGFALYARCRRAAARARPDLVELRRRPSSLYATLNERLYGGPTPWSATARGVTATGAQTAADYLERVPRLLMLWVDPGVGLLRWAPIFASCSSPAGCCTARAGRFARVVCRARGRRGGGRLVLAVVGAQCSSPRSWRRLAATVRRPLPRPRAAARPRSSPGASATRRGRSPQRLPRCRLQRPAGSC